MPFKIGCGGGQGVDGKPIRESRPLEMYPRFQSPHPPTHTTSRTHPQARSPRPLFPLFLRPATPCRAPDTKSSGVLVSCSSSPHFLHHCSKEANPPYQRQRDKDHGVHDRRQGSRGWRCIHWRRRLRPGRGGSQAVPVWGAGDDTQEEVSRWWWDWGGEECIVGRSDPPTPLTTQPTTAAGPIVTTRTSRWRARRAATTTRYVVYACAGEGPFPPPPHLHPPTHPFPSPFPHHRATMTTIPTPLPLPPPPMTTKTKPSLPPRPTPPPPPRPTSPPLLQSSPSGP